MVKQTLFHFRTHELIKFDSIQGIYVCLFMAALPQLMRKHKNMPARVFLTGNVLMFILISVHGGLLSSDISLADVSLRYL